MIGVPFNDLRCLGAITEVVAELVKNGDPVIAEIAKQHHSVEALAEWIRTLPQRDDDGLKNDGPKVDECKPPQRLRIPAENPNCVERASLYVAVAELIDPEPTRQLATLDTPIGLHTFPVENGSPITLDPRVPRNCLDCSLAIMSKRPVQLDVHDTIDWTAQIAESGAANHRNGPSRVRRARNAMVRLVDKGLPPANDREVEDMGWMFAVAEQVANRMGQRALQVLRTTAIAVAELVDEAIARQMRNVALEIGGARYAPSPWMSMLAKVGGNVGMNIGAVALRAYLAKYGIGDDMIGLVEDELNKEGLTLGTVAKPPKLPTIANFMT